MQNSYLEQAFDNLECHDPKQNNDAGGCEILYLLAADIPNDVHDPSKDICECLHGLDAQVP